MRASEPGSQDVSVVAQEARRWLIRLHSGDATPEDAAAFRQWRNRSPEHAQQFAEARALWQALAPAANDPMSSHVVLIAGHAQAQWRAGRRAMLGGGLAAAAAAYLAVRPPWQLWPAVTDLMADYRTGTGEQREVALADGIVVHMNTRTRVSQRTRAGADAGIELLDGEVEVQMPRTAAPGQGGWLVVQAGAGRVRARNAVFNVRYTDADVCVTCLDGTVELQQAQQRADLAAGQQAVFDTARLGPVAAANTQAVTAWRRGILMFHDMPLAQAVEEINRYRPGRLVIVGDWLRARRIDGQFAIDQLPHIETMIRDAYGAGITRLAGGVVLLS